MLKGANDLGWMNAADLAKNGDFKGAGMAIAAATTIDKLPPLAILSVGGKIVKNIVGSYGTKLGRWRVGLW